MKDLSDLITDRAQDLDVQISHAKKLEPTEIEWLKYKKEIDKLPKDWQTYYADLVNKYPNKCRKFQSSKKNGEKVIQIICKIPQPMEFLDNTKFRMELVFNTDGEGAEAKAYYVGFNNLTAITHTRWLIKPN